MKKNNKLNTAWKWGYEGKKEEQNIITKYKQRKERRENRINGWTKEVWIEYSIEMRTQRKKGQINEGNKE